MPVKRLKNSFRKTTRDEEKIPKITLLNFDHFSLIKIRSCMCVCVRYKSFMYFMRSFKRNHINDSEGEVWENFQHISYSR